MATLEKRKIYCPGGNQTIIPWLSSPQPSHYTKLKTGAIPLLYLYVFKAWTGTLYVHLSSNK